MNSMPPDLQASTSSCLIGRDAPATSTSPRQNFLKPPPVPDAATVTSPLPAFPKSSATAMLIRYTVLEPSTVTRPPPPPPVVGLSVPPVSLVLLLVPSPPFSSLCFEH